MRSAQDCGGGDGQPNSKWLKVTAHPPSRRKIAGLNYLLTSHGWRQDHDGFTHQDPGFIDRVVNKKAEVVNLMNLQPPSEHLNGLSDMGFRPDLHQRTR